MVVRERPSRLLAFTVAFVGMLAFMQVYSVQAVLPELQMFFQASPLELGWVVGATVLGMALLSPFIGMISDRFGRRFMICASIFLYTLPVAASAFVESVYALIVLRFLLGVFVPGMTVCLIAYLGEEFAREDLASLMAFYVMGTVLGGFSGRFLLGYLSVYFSWQFGMLVLASLSFLGFLLVCWQLPASRFFVPQRDFKASFQGLLAHLQNPVVLGVCALGFCVLFSLVGAFSFVNLHLADAPYFWSSRALANLFAVYLLGMLVTPVSAFLMRRFGARRSLLLAIVFQMFGVFLSLSSSVFVLVFALAVLASGVFVTQSATISYLSMRIDKARSLATGLYYMAYYSGGAVGACVCALAFAGYKWSGVVFTLFIAQCMALFIVWRFFLREDK